MDGNAAPAGQGPGTFPKVRHARDGRDEKERRREPIADNLPSRPEVKEWQPDSLWRQKGRGSGLDDSLLLAWDLDGPDAASRSPQTWHSAASSCIMNSLLLDLLYHRRWSSDVLLYLLPESV